MLRALLAWFARLFRRRTPGTCTLGVPGCTGHYDLDGREVY
jgi:hypothetical protein